MFANLCNNKVILSAPKLVEPKLLLAVEQAWDLSEDSVSCSGNQWIKLCQ